MREAHESTEGYHKPGRYEIRLKGHVDARWAERLAGLTFSHESDGTTVLFGPVVDQAALYGLPRTVRDLDLPFLSVVHIDPEQADRPDVQPGPGLVATETEATP